MSEPVANPALVISLLRCGISFSVQGWLSLAGILGEARAMDQCMHPFCGSALQNTAGELVSLISGSKSTAGKSSRSMQNSLFSL